MIFTKTSLWTFHLCTQTKNLLTSCIYHFDFHHVLQLCVHEKLPHFLFVQALDIQGLNNVYGCTTPIDVICFKHYFSKKKIIINIFEKKSLTKFTSLQNCLPTYCNFDVNESILYKIQNNQPTGTKHRRKRKGNEINQWLSLSAAFC